MHRSLSVIQSMSFIGVFCLQPTHIFSTMQMRVRGKFATPCVVAVRTRGAVSLISLLYSVLAPTQVIATSVGIILGKAECR